MTRRMRRSLFGLAILVAFGAGGYFFPFNVRSSCQ